MVYRGVKLRFIAGRISLMVALHGSVVSVRLYKYPGLCRIAAGTQPHEGRKEEAHLSVVFRT